MLNSLIIGNTSQLSYFFPEEYDRISSRNIDIVSLNRYDKIYITFAEQRTFLNESEKFYTDINVDYTLSIIDKVKHLCNRVVVFSTSELWNDYEGKVSLDLNYKYDYTPYIKSKHILCEKIIQNRDYYNNVDIIYTFNFNSVYRRDGFLFSKIFKSLIKREKNSVGDLNINRDVIHPSIIVNNIINTNGDQLIGSGELININTFIVDLYKNFDLDSSDYLIFDNKNNLSNKRKEYYSDHKYSNYVELLNLTVSDIKKIIKI